MLGITWSWVRESIKNKIYALQEFGGDTKNAELTFANMSLKIDKCSGRIQLWAAVPSIGNDPIKACYRNGGALGAGHYLWTTPKGALYLKPADSDLIRFSLAPSDLLHFLEGPKPLQQHSKHIQSISQKLLQYSPLDYSQKKYNTVLHVSGHGLRDAAENWSRAHSKDLRTTDKYLAEHGILGIGYNHGRHDNPHSQNFVVFDPSCLKIEDIKLKEKRGAQEQ